MHRWTGILSGLVFSAAGFAAQPPASLLDLSTWMLTLPVDTDRPGHPDEIKQPELETFLDPHWFFVDHQVGGVVFRAHCGGDTTKGSRFPRCELRERTDQGKASAAWSTAGDGEHTMTMKVAITKTPPVKKHVVCAQIHDAEDDLMMIRLEGTKLFIERNDFGDVMLDRQYKIGTPFVLKIQVSDGHIKVWYDGDQKMDWQVSKSGCYFKAGCYTQSNPDKGDLAESVGEVVIYQLQVVHP